MYQNSPPSFSNSISKGSYCRPRIQPQLIMQMSGNHLLFTAQIVISPHMKKDPSTVNPQWLWNLLHNKHLIQILVVESDLIFKRGRVVYEHKTPGLEATLRGHPSQSLGLGQDHLYLHYSAEMLVQPVLKSLSWRKLHNFPEPSSPEIQDSCRKEKFLKV